LENARRKELISRIEASLQQSRDDKSLWLLGNRVTHPYQTNGNNQERKASALQLYSHKLSNSHESKFNSLGMVVADAFSSDSNLDDVDSVSISEFFLSPDKGTAFISDAFDELEKCRYLMRWSYAFCMFEIEEVLKHQKHLNPIWNPVTHTLDSPYRLNQIDHNNLSLHSSSSLSEGSHNRHLFLTLQSLLEYHTEQLSDLLSRPRIRYCRDQLKQAMLDATNSRIDLESVLANSEENKGVSVRPFDAPLLQNVKEGNVVDSTYT